MTSSLESWSGNPRWLFCLGNRGKEPVRQPTILHSSRNATASMLQRTMVINFPNLNSLYHIFQKVVNTEIKPNNYKEQKIITFNRHFPNIFHQIILNSDFTIYIVNIYLIYSATTESWKCVKIVMVSVYHNTY